MKSATKKTAPAEKARCQRRLDVGRQNFVYETNAVRFTLTQGRRQKEGSVT